MHITSREKDIIELIIKSAGRYTTYSIAKLLHVSTRTIQRDLNSIEKLLLTYELQLVRNANKELSIEGKNEQIFRLVQLLASTETIDQTPEERKLLLFIALLEADFCKTQILANQLGVSITTLTTYLDELNEFVSRFHLQIQRRRGVGVELIGNESNKRRALARYYLYFFYEAILEELFALNRVQESNKKVLHYFQTNYLFSIEQIVHQIMYESQSKLTDHDFVGVMIHICIAAQRTEQGHMITSKDDIAEVTDERIVIAKICDKLTELYSLTFTEADQQYLSIILKGSKLQAAESVPYDRADLNRLVSHLIQYVSSELNLDLTRDFSLHQGLLAHLEPSLFRLKEKMGLFNPLKDEIKQKYPVLFLAVKRFFTTEFMEIEEFPEDEIAFIVLHFGSALVIWEEQFRLSALLICPTGIGTSKMLASRIKKEFIEIETVDTLSLKELQQEDLNKYDLILSTVRLPFINIQYLYVSPLLYDEDIERVKAFLEKNIKNFMKNKQYQQQLPTQIKESNQTLSEALQEIKSIHDGVEQLMNHFIVFHSNMNNVDDALLQMLEHAEKKQALQQPDQVMTALKEREKKGGLGIPGTKMALFHCRDSGIHQLSFQMTIFDTPILIKGMDGKEMPVTSLLLLLAPEHPHPRQLELISMISANLIDSPETIMKYSVGDEQVIKEHLEIIMLEYIQAKTM